MYPCTKHNNTMNLHVPPMLRFNRSPQYNFYPQTDYDHPRSDQPQSTTNQPPINTELSTLCRTLFKTIQFQHHISNWTTLTQSLKRYPENMANTITPPEPDDDICRKINNYLREAGENIRQHVTEHLQSTLNRNLGVLKGLNPAQQGSPVTKRLNID